MAASTFTGTSQFWHQGMVMDGSMDIDTVVQYQGWQQGMPNTRNYGTPVPAIVANIMSAQWPMPVRGPRKAVAYGSQ
jgi:hypothetical protein